METLDHNQQKELLVRADALKIQIQKIEDELRKTKGLLPELKLRM